MSTAEVIGSVAMVAIFAWAVVQIMNGGGK
jgi:hypothetical protein